MNECLGCSASCFFATVYCGNVCGGCDSSGGGDDDTAPPRGKFGVSFFYDADRDGNWDAEESALSVNHASVRNSIVTVLNIPGFRLYNYQGLSIENNVCLENTAANCTDRGDSACVCPNVDETCGVVHRPRKQYVTSGNVYWTCDGNDSSPRTLYSEGYHWVRAATGNNCIGQEICVWRAQGLGLSTNNLDVLAGPEIGGGNPSVSFQFNLPGGWETTRIKWNTSYYPSNNVGSQILTSDEGVTSISTNLEDAGSIAARYKIVGRIIHVGVVEDVNPPQVISVSPNNASICTGDNRSFTTTYSDADGAADIAHAQLNIVDSSVQSGDNHVPAYWYTRASLKLDENPPRFFFWGPLEEGATRPSSPAVWRNNRWELNTPLRSASNRAELNAVNSEIPGSGTYAVLSGNNVVVNWDINFDSDYYPGPGNYPRTHNLLLWVFDDAGLE
ncbi:hypothetical protein KKD62_01140, partial [Patescibacteria group bacterium]|nr:hypothetical protein [Patescibacteria group bacterium]MBU1931354.1 hypothetical protein [Patescibacteria group bacterium]